MSVVTDVTPNRQSSCCFITSSQVSKGPSQPKSAEAKANFPRQRYTRSDPAPAPGPPLSQSWANTHWPFSTIRPTISPSSLRPLMVFLRLGLRQERKRKRPPTHWGAVACPVFS
jgi:hypothetical protein